MLLNLSYVINKRREYFWLNIKLKTFSKLILHDVLEEVGLLPLLQPSSPHIVLVLAYVMVQDLCLVSLLAVAQLLQDLRNNEFKQNIIFFRYIYNLFKVIKVFFLKNIFTIVPIHIGIEAGKEKKGN